MHSVITYGPYRQGHHNNHYIGCQKGAQQEMVWIRLTSDGRSLGHIFFNGNLDSGVYLHIIK